MAHNHQVTKNYTSASSEEARTQELITKIKLFNNGPSAIGVQGDISDFKTGQKLVDGTLKGFKNDHIGILVNSAGTAGAPVSLEQITPEEFNFVYGINVKGLIFVTQAVVKYMGIGEGEGRGGRGGRIINLSSVAARMGTRGITVYNGKKAALEGLRGLGLLREFCFSIPSPLLLSWLKPIWFSHPTHRRGRKLLLCRFRDRFGPRSITVNAVNPGPVDTDMYRQSPKQVTEAMDVHSKVIAGGRTGEGVILWRLWRGWRVRGVGRLRGVYLVLMGYGDDVGCHDGRQAIGGI